MVLFNALRSFVRPSIATSGLTAASQLASQPANQPASQSASQLASQPASQSASQPASQPAKCIEVSAPRGYIAGNQSCIYGSYGEWKVSPSPSLFYFAGSTFKSTVALLSLSLSCSRGSTSLASLCVLTPIFPSPFLSFFSLSPLFGCCSMNFPDIYRDSNFLNSKG